MKTVACAGGTLRQAHGVQMPTRGPSRSDRKKWALLGFKSYGSAKRDTSPAASRGAGNPTHPWNGLFEWCSVYEWMTKSQAARTGAPLAGRKRPPARGGGECPENAPGVGIQWDAPPNGMRRRNTAGFEHFKDRKKFAALAARLVPN